MCEKHLTTLTARVRQERRGSIAEEEEGCREGGRDGREEGGREPHTETVDEQREKPPTHRQDDVEEDMQCHSVWIESIASLAWCAPSCARPGHAGSFKLPGFHAETDRPKEKLRTHHGRFVARRWQARQQPHSDFNTRL